MQKYATRGHGDIGPERALTAVTVQAADGEKLSKPRDVADRNVFLATFPVSEYTMGG
jgi:hypothetical protein